MFLWEVQGGLFLGLGRWQRNKTKNKQTTTKKHRDRNQSEGGCESRGPQILVKTVKKLQTFKVMDFVGISANGTNLCLNFNRLKDIFIADKLPRNYFILNYFNCKTITSRTDSVLLQDTQQRCDII